MKVVYGDGYIVTDDLMLLSIYDGHRFGEPFVSVCGVLSIGYSSVIKRARATEDLFRRESVQHITVLD
jgi:hypothetical protein